LSPRDDRRSLIAAGVHNVIRLKKRLFKHLEVTRNPTLRAEVNNLQRSETHHVNYCRNEKWSAALESLDPEDQSLWRMTKEAMRVPTLSPPLVTRGDVTFSDSEKAESLAESLEAYCQLITLSLVLDFFKKFDLVLRFYFTNPAIKSKLTNPVEVYKVIWGLKFGRATGPNGIPNRALKHLPR
jgi:hypothetical protein